MTNDNPIDDAAARLAQLLAARRTHGTVFVQPDEYDDARKFIVELVCDGWHPYGATARARVTRLHDALCDALLGMYDAGGNIDDELIKHITRVLNEVYDDTPRRNNDNC